MNEEVKRAVYINLLLLAMADGEIVPAERAYLRRFTESAGITEAEERAWQQEIQKERSGFVPITDQNAARDALAIMARMVRVDNAFEASEQDAYINMGKALGINQEQLGAVLREVWANDPVAALDAVSPNKVSSDAAIVFVVKENIEDRQDLIQSASHLELSFVPLAALSKVTPPPRIVLFHAADDKNDSKKILTALRSQLPETKIVFIARRDQAPQIGWLLGMGADRCFVEPLYPNEIGRAVAEMFSG
jgi:DNA-binding NarL/FixJ family response regulator